ncbi:separin-like [Branchiostoma floridae]|uniref:separase n=1 Tax=Branchiostoma floridae TaxID=7739 RepID=A0A9J7NBP4_BRAFL|nr:separin-like [Branchiostoma floridae]
MADSDRIILGLKNGEDVGKLVSEIQTYLAPLLKTGAAVSQLPADSLKKYGLFCMRLLRACFESLGKLKPGSADVANTVRVSHISYKCIQLCQPHMQFNPLALEKLLYHIMTQLLTKNLLSDALTIAGFLHRELKSFQTSGTMTSESEEELTNIAKHSFDKLLKAALRICDPKAQTSNLIARQELALTAGQQALHILMLSGVDPQWFPGRVVSIAKHFEDMFRRSVSGYERISKFCKTVYGDMLEHVVTKSEDMPTQVCLLQVGFQVCRYLQLAKKEKEAMLFINQMIQGLQGKASQKNESQELLLASARVFKASLLCTAAVGGHKPDWRSIKTDLEESNRAVRDRMDKLDHSAGMVLVESYNQLRKSLESVVEAGRQCMVLMSTSEFCSVEAALNLFMDVLQAQRGSSKGQKGPLDPQQCVKLQMATVSLLLEMMKVYISVRADRDVLPGSLVALQRAMGIIEDVSSGNGGSLSTSELKYLGSHIYNLSICVYNHDWYEDALPLIQAAVQLLQRWCQASGQPDSDREVKLAERFWLLSECQLKLDLCEDAMCSAASALLADPSHMTMQVESWVRAKREAVEKDGDLKSRTLRDAVLSLDTSALDQDQMIKVLQEELRMLQLHRYDSSYEQYCVICDLLDVQGDSRLQERAHTMTQLGQLLLSSPGSITSNCTAVECCEEAVFLLEEMVANQGPDCEVSTTTLHDDLATAYMWLYMCKQQESLAQVPKLDSSQKQCDKEKDKDSQLTYTENETSLNKLLSNISLQDCQLGPAEVAMAYLDHALENWCLVIREGLDLSAVRTVESTAKCLKITSSTYGLAGRPFHQARTLHLLATLMEAAQDYEEAVFTVATATIAMCLHGNSCHGDQLLTKAESLVGKLEDNSRALLLLKVAKSHFLLLTGEVSVGWTQLCEVLSSPILEECSTICYMLSAQARHVQSLYLRLPLGQAHMDRAGSHGQGRYVHVIQAHMHRTGMYMLYRLCYMLSAQARHVQSLYLRLPLGQAHMDRAEGSSCFETAFDAFRVRLSLARLLFGDRFKETDRLVTASSASKSNSAKTKRGYPHLPWWCCDDFLTSLLDMGKLYSDQGCVKEAKSYFLEGLEIAANFKLPRRCAQFLTMLAEVELHRGLTEDCQLLLKSACSVLASTDNKQDLSKPLLNKRDFSTSRISVSKDSVSFDDQSPDPSKGNRTATEKERKRTQNKKDARRQRKSAGCFGFDVLESEGSEDEDDNFIRSKLISVSQQLEEDDGIDSDLEDYGKHQPSFPTMQLPDYVSHNANCTCSVCKDVVSQTSYLDVFLTATECALSEGLPAVAIATAAASQKIHGKVCTCVSSVMKDFASSLIQGKKRETKSKKNSNTEHLYAPQLALLHCRLSEAYLMQENFSKAHANIENGLLLFQGKSRAIHLHSNTQAHLLYNAALCAILQEAAKCNCSPFDVLNCNPSTQADVVGNLEKCMEKLSIKSVQGSLDFSAAKKEAMDSETYKTLQALEESATATSAKQKNGRQGQKPVIKIDLPEDEEGVIDPEVIHPDVDADEVFVPHNPETSGRNVPKASSKKSSRRKKEESRIEGGNNNFEVIPDSDDVFVVNKPESSRKYLAKASAKKGSRRKKAEDDISDLQVIPDTDTDECTDKKTADSGTSRKFFTSKTPARGTLNRKKGACEDNKDAEQMGGPVRRPLLGLGCEDVDDYTFVGSPETSKTRRGRGRGSATSKTPAPETARKSARGKKGQTEVTEADSKRKPRCAKVSEKATSKDTVSTQAKSTKGKSTKKTVFIMSDSDSDAPLIALPPSTLKKRPQRKATSVVYKEESSSDDSEGSTVPCKPRGLRAARQPKTAPPSTRGRGRRAAKKPSIDDYCSSDDEILRGASSEEEEECAPVVKRRGRAAKTSTARGKKPSARPKPSTEDVEVLRECVQIGEDEDSTLGSTLLTTSSLQEAVPVLGGRTTPCGSSIADATVHLETAQRLIEHTRPSLLSRRIGQLLFLCCPEDSSRLAAYYMTETCSVTLRHQMLASLHKKIKKLQKAEMRSMTESMDQLSLTGAPPTQQEIQLLRTKQNIFGLNPSPSKHSYNADNMQDVLAKQLPEGWTICSMALLSITPCCYGNNVNQQLLVITRLRADSEPLIIKIPVSQATLEGEILRKLETIQHDNKTSVAIQDKKLYWKARQELDSMLKDLTKAMENELLGGWKGAVLGHHGDRRREKQLNSAAINVCKALGSDNKVDFQLLKLLLDSWPHLRKRQKHDSLAFLLGSSTGSPLLQNGLDLMQKEASKITDLEDLQDRGPVIMVLDRTLQRLPWESIPILQQGKVSRMPSLRFILSHLHSMRLVPGHVLCDGVDQNNTYYVLNPRNDLPSTQASFQDDFKKRGWRGVVGVSPTTDQYIRALTDHDMFVYCGHGAGQVYLKGDEIQKITTRATTLLMGCGSGRLFVEGCTEARGMALNYILSGCPSIVANLWDVTDRDIDRFLQALLKSWLTSGSESSLLEFVSQSREACKLRHLIGAAPVVYGFPVHVK